MFVKVGKFDFEIGNYQKENCVIDCSGQVMTDSIE